MRFTCVIAILISSNLLAAVRVVIKLLSMYRGGSKLRFSKSWWHVTILGVAGV